MDSKKRQEVRAELVSQGFSWSYVDSWPPKTTLYVHRPMLNPDGQVVNDRGVALPNMPGHPDFVSRKSRIGLLPWPPNEECKCKACREYDWHPAPPIVAVSPQRSEVTTIRIEELQPTAHPHKFGKAMGAACKIPGCTAVRQRVYTARSRAA